MFRDKDYVVKDDEVLIVDEFTGRIMPGRRYSDGLHQAIEAKEHVNVRRESRTCYRNIPELLQQVHQEGRYDRYCPRPRKKSSGNIYAMDVIVIPTNRPMIRKDLEDAVYKTKKENTKQLWMRWRKHMRRDSLFWWVPLPLRPPSF